MGSTSTVTLQAEGRGAAQPQARRERKANGTVLNLTEGLSHLAGRCVPLAIYVSCTSVNIF